MNPEGRESAARDDEEDPMSLGREIKLGSISNMYTIINTPG